MQDKRLPKEKCTLAGVTKDGVECFFGKKESDNPESRDLTYWVAVGPPRSSGNNYVRISWIGIDESALLQECSKLPIGSFSQVHAKKVADHIAQQSSREMRRIARLHYATL